ncbi:tetratricopeptide repeat protein [Paenibacillus sp. T1]|uniref:Tetratricopeptide repeat protein n=2 Tax=Paenibacillus glycinis TaxID=2697035 RepID=A0ABW9XST4_9BACL|nr:tetratricopeptide repeat protein [Paenibacillus glycinis]
MKRFPLWISAGIGLLAAAYLIFANGNGIGTGADMRWKTKLAGENETAVRLMNENKYEEALTALQIAVQDVYDHDPSLEEAKEERTLSDPVLDVPLSNMSWAYNEMGDYRNGLAAIRKALLLLPNTAEEYVNEGNALYGLNRGEEALASFDRALALDPDARYAFYGKGVIHYEAGEYAEALKDLDRYLAYEPDDMEAAEKKMFALLNAGGNDEAAAYGDALVKDYPDEYEAYRLKNEAMRASADYEAIQAFDRMVAAKFPGNPRAQELLGGLYGDYGQYDDARDYYLQLLNDNPAESSIYLALMNNESDRDDVDAALGFYRDAARADAADPELHRTMGRIYEEATDYMAAVPYYEQAIKLDPQDEEAVIGKIRSLYRAKRNIRCADYVRDAEAVRASKSDIAFYGGKCNEELGRNAEAEAYFEQAVEADPGDAEALAELAALNLTLRRDDSALDFSEKTLRLDTDNADALYVQRELQERKKPLGERVKAFFAASYMYGAQVNDEDVWLAKLDEPSITPAEIGAVIDRARLPDDPFTFAVWGEDYDAATSEDERDVDVRNEGSVVYMRIAEFGEHTDDRFLAALDAVEQPAGKTLVIDLRGNAGGLAVSANNMLDGLLPDVVMSTVLYKDGQAEPYESDASHVDFKHVYVLVDERTASASELLALGLRTYLPNATIVGRTTLGKGVGQQAFMDDEQGIAVFAVNFYWNVRERNIMGTGITPDIAVRGDALADFMKPVLGGRT